jgi:hypothetical protein
MKTCNPYSKNAKSGKHICNPETGRWVLANGVIGKKIKAKRGGMPPPKPKRASPKPAPKRNSEMNKGKMLAFVQGAGINFHILEMFLNKKLEYTGKPISKEFFANMLYLPYNAPDRRIKMAYLRAIVKVHPDKNKIENKKYSDVVTRILNAGKSSNLRFGRKIKK